MCLVRTDFLHTIANDPPAFFLYRNTIRQTPLYNNTPHKQAQVKQLEEAKKRIQTDDAASAASYPLQAMRTVDPRATLLDTAERMLDENKGASDEGDMETGLTESLPAW